MCFNVFYLGFQCLAEKHKEVIYQNTVKSNQTKCVHNPCCLTVSVRQQGLWETSLSLVVTVWSMSVTQMGTCGLLGNDSSAYWSVVPCRHGWSGSRLAWNTFSFPGGHATVLLVTFFDSNLQICRDAWSHWKATHFTEGVHAWYLELYIQMRLLMERGSCL